MSPQTIIRESFQKASDNAYKPMYQWTMTSSCLWSDVRTWIQAMTSLQTVILYPQVKTNRMLAGLILMETAYINTYNARSYNLDKGFCLPSVGTAVDGASKILPFWGYCKTSTRVTLPIATGVVTISPGFVECGIFFSSVENVTSQTWKIPKHQANWNHKHGLIDICMQRIIKAGPDLSPKAGIASKGWSIMQTLKNPLISWLRC